ncbi:MAG: MMPL family transporter [Pirellulales bacterium]
MFAHLGSFCARRWPLVIALWLIATALLAAFAPAWKDVARDGDLDYLPANMPSVRGRAMLAEAFPDRTSKSQIVVVVERTDGPLSAQDLAFADAVGAVLEATESLPIADVWTPSTPQIGRLLKSVHSPNGQAAIVVANLNVDFAATQNIKVLATVERRVAEVFAARADEAAGLKWGITGSAAVGGDMLSAAAESVRNTEWTTTLMVLVILLLVYRAPLLALVPLFTMGITIVAATSLIALLTQLHNVPLFDWWSLKVFTTTRIFLVVVLFGSGTDFCLFLISRYREELEHGRGPDSAIIRALGHVGEALSGSAFTTMVGLGAMVFAEFGKYRNSGPSIAICLGVALLSCVTLAPAMLAALGPRVFWPARLKRIRGNETLDEAVAGAGRFGWLWNRIAETTIRRPGTVLIAALVILSPLGIAGVLRSEPTYDILEELGRNRTSVVGTRMLERHFSAGEFAPVSILAYVESGGLGDSETVFRAMPELWSELCAIDGVRSVRCLPRPLGELPFSLRFDGARQSAASFAKARQQYLSQTPSLEGKIAKFDVILAYPPFSREAIAVLDVIQERLTAISAGQPIGTKASSAKSTTAKPATPESETKPHVPTLDRWHGAEFYYAGTVAGIRDLVAVTQRDERKIQILVVISVAVVLLVLLRRPAVCAYLILTVVGTYLVTIGTTELLFRAAYGDTFVGLDWKVSVFLFVLLVAIGQDYNVYLTTRVFEEQRRRGPIDGLRFAVVRTGGIITSCGVIMAATFVSMVTGSLRFMVELGFALSLGVMLDTCVVRPVLVPAFLALRLRIGEALGRRWT